MKEIKITTGEIVLVDDEDFDQISKYQWRMLGRYPVMITPRRGKIFRMHHTVYGQKVQLDHKDRNRLNCQKDNLRPATATQNAQNRGVSSTNTSGFKGVHYYAANGLWQVAIKFEGKKLHLGYFQLLHEAVRAYNNKAKELFGEFACVNPEGKDWPPA